MKAERNIYIQGNVLGCGVAIKLPNCRSCTSTKGGTMICPMLSMAMGLVFKCKENECEWWVKDHCVVKDLPNPIEKGEKDGD